MGIARLMKYFLMYNKSSANKPFARNRLAFSFSCQMGQSMIEYISPTSSRIEVVKLKMQVGAIVSAVLSCEDTKQVQGGTMRGKR